MMNTPKNQQPSEADKAITQILNESVIYFGLFCALLGHAFWLGVKEIKSFSRLVFGASVIALVTYLTVHYHWHLNLLNDLAPDFFHYDRINAIYALGLQKNAMVVSMLLSTISLWVIGLIPLYRFRHYQKAFDSIGLKNANDQKPKVLSVTRLDEYRTKLKVLVTGVGIEKIKAKQDELQSALEKDIEEINRLKNPKYIEVILSTKFLPDFVTFKELDSKLNESESFLIGESKKGTETEKISNLPHMLIAGTTGGGKSQFFKQFLLGLLKSTNHMQMYLVDLKGGLEFREFADLPNVKVCKTIDDAVSTLRLVKKEMERRFSYLEKKGLKQINPNQHPFDRIVIGIDEASVLYAQARRDSLDYPLVCEARDLTENIAKLGRAASLHLVLATQKVSKETIDTRIQENISGRMCFKLNTTEGSVRVLGNAKASHLPAIAGRGIWQFGSNEIEVQTPYLDSSISIKELQEVAESYNQKAKTLNQPLGFVDISQSSSVPVKKPNLTKEDISHV